MAFNDLFFKSYVFNKKLVPLQIEFLGKNKKR